VVVAGGRHKGKMRNNVNKALFLLLLLLLLNNGNDDDDDDDNGDDDGDDGDGDDDGGDDGDRDDDNVVNRTILRLSPSLPRYREERQAERDGLVLWERCAWEAGVVAVSLPPHTSTLPLPFITLTTSCWHLVLCTGANKDDDHSAGVSMLQETIATTDSTTIAHQAAGFLLPPLFLLLFLFTHR